MWRYARGTDIIHIVYFSRALFAYTSAIPAEYCCWHRAHGNDQTPNYKYIHICTILVQRLLFNEISNGTFGRAHCLQFVQNFNFASFFSSIFRSKWYKKAFVRHAFLFLFSKHIQMMSSEMHAFHSTLSWVMQQIFHIEIKMHINLCEWLLSELQFSNCVREATTRREKHILTGINQSLYVWFN